MGSVPRVFVSGGRGPTGARRRAAFYTRTRVTFEQALQIHNRGMIALDLALGAGAVLAPEATLRQLGHAAPSADARELFRRCGPVWLTFSAAHAVAAVRGRPEDWWALAWLRGTEVFTDVLWARSPAFSEPRSRAALVGAGISNLGMALAFAWRATKGGHRPPFATPWARR